MEGAVIESAAVIRYPSVPAIGKGTREAEDDLVSWLRAVCEAQIWANEAGDMEAYKFMLDLYNAIS
jgi:hypothetical protein